MKSKQHAQYREHLHIYWPVGWLQASKFQYLSKIYEFITDLGIHIVCMECRPFATKIGNIYTYHGWDDN